MKLRAAGMAEQEELRWKAAAGALHRQQEVYLRVLERTVCLEPLRAGSTAEAAGSDHIVALEAAVVASREAHASTLREAREREISLEAHVSEQAAALRGQAAQLDAISRRSRYELEQAERRAEAERRAFALEMRGVEDESFTQPDRMARLRAALERRLLARELRGLELRAPPVAEEEVDFEAASADAIRSLEAAFASLRRKAEVAEADQQEQAELEWQRTRTAELASALFQMAVSGGGGGRAAGPGETARGGAAADMATDADVEDEVEAARAAYGRSRACATAASSAAVAHAQARPRDVTEEFVRVRQPATAAETSRAVLEPSPHEPDEASQLRQLRLKYEELKSQHLRHILREAELLRRTTRETPSSTASHTRDEGATVDGVRPATEAMQAVASAATAWGSPRRPSPAFVARPRSPTDRQPTSLRDAAQRTRAQSPSGHLPACSLAPASRGPPPRLGSPLRKTARRSFPVPPQISLPLAEPSPPKRRCPSPRYLAPTAASPSYFTNAQSPTIKRNPNGRLSPGRSLNRSPTGKRRVPPDANSNLIPNDRGSARAPAASASSSLEGCTLLERVLEQQKRLLKDLDSSRQRRDQLQHRPPSPTLPKQGSLTRRSVAPSAAASPRRASFRDPPRPDARPMAAAQASRRSASAGRTRPQRPLAAATSAAAAQALAKSACGHTAAGA
eukprot:scaffold20806_cov107-Isochrysis_galbana.AAC.4